LNRMQEHMHYREVAPRQDLAPWVLSFWEFSVTAKIAPFVHRVFPDGCTVISYSLRLPPEVPMLRVSGPLLGPREMIVHPPATAWGVRLQPAACRAVLGCSPLAILNKTCEANEIVEGRANRELLEQLDRCANFQDAIAAFEVFLRNQIQPGQLDTQMAKAADRIARKRGQLPISQIADSVGLGVRQLERRFKDAIGLTPKQFARARRFRTAAVALAKGSERNWAELAAELGFSDQPHLVRDFFSLSKIAPSDLGKLVRRIKHGRLVDPMP